MQFCTFTLDGMTLGVEVARVQEAIKYQAMTSVPLASSTVGGLINLRGQIVTAIDLRRRFDLDDRAEGVNPMNVVVRAPEGVVSLLVDQIGDVVDVNDDDFEGVPDTLAGVARDLIKGAYKLDRGLLLVLDTERAVSTAAALIA